MQLHQNPRSSSFASRPLLDTFQKNQQILLIEPRKDGPTYHGVRVYFIYMGGNVTDLRLPQPQSHTCSGICHPTALNPRHRPSCPHHEVVVSRPHRLAPNLLLGGFSLMGWISRTSVMELRRIFRRTTDPLSGQRRRSDSLCGTCQRSRRLGENEPPMTELLSRPSMCAFCC
jgi:hypothetical protein